MTKLKLIKRPTERQFDTSADRLARSFAPKIYECRKCGWPVADGYICMTCGCTNPKAHERG